MLISPVRIEFISHGVNCLGNRKVCTGVATLVVYVVLASRLGRLEGGEWGRGEVGGKHRLNVLFTYPVHTY